MIIENTMVLAALDIAAEVHSFTADDHTIYIVVTDGTLNVRFITRTGFGVPKSTPWAFSIDPICKGGLELNK